MLSVSVMLGGLMACAPKTSSPSATATATATESASSAGVQDSALAGRFHLSVEGRFSTTGQDRLPPEAAALLEDVALTLDLTVRREVARPFRDGSLGHLVVFEAATGMLSREGAGASAVAVPLELAGRSVELRTFPDGELLDVSLVEHVVGAGRYGDVFDLIFPVMSPAPPGVISERSGAVARAMHWPVRLSRVQGVKHTLWAQWQLVTRSREGATLQYSGPWEGKGANPLQTADARDPSARLPVEARGTGEGEVRLDAQGRLLAHRFSWQREVQLSYPGGIELVQKQRFSGNLERLP